MKDDHGEQVSPPHEESHRGCAADETAHRESPTPNRHMKGAEAEQRKYRRKPEAADQDKEPGHGESAKQRLLHHACTYDGKHPVPERKSHYFFHSRSESR